MTAPELLQALEACGTAQNRKVYRRHGVIGPQFGVSYANLNALRKKAKRNHEAAVELWKSGNHDARVLATMIADPKTAGSALLQAWSEDLDSYVLTDAFAKLAGGTKHAEALMREWMDAGHEWKGQAAWCILAQFALQSNEVPDEFFLPFLSVIERVIHGRHNRERHAMNMALVAIGMRGDALEKEALRVADAIGTVHVDHGETSCKTPDAAAYIQRAKARKSSRRKRVGSC